MNTIPTHPARGNHRSLPVCVHCGNARGPWVPNGDRDENGSQLFRCAPGIGCQADDTRADRAVDQLAAAVDHLPADVIANELGITTQAWRARIEHRARMTVSEFVRAALVAGVRAADLLDDSPAPLLIDRGRIVEAVAQ
ncbi:hypothetical protein KO481_21480 [Nocardia sp. NEAU-G5]|uniref:Uncharacterized protein n=1 Tax=Nocardia albiluteola TaxID=2842303 RepID=A0ABS6B3S7_9NOCA|nr:hypothetical protein [Nocardia albiluteola]MBU3064091.1 hypothetical protein [Nocardia albiluteola]